MVKLFIYSLLTVFSSATFCFKDIPVISIFPLLVANLQGALVCPSHSICLNEKLAFSSSEIRPSQRSRHSRFGHGTLKWRLIFFLNILVKCLLSSFLKKTSGMQLYPLLLPTCYLMHPPLVFCLLFLLLGEEILKARLRC